MRARYYSPELRRFVNADILMGDINNSPSLNRYAYANGNPISNIDPFGLAADSRGSGTTIEAAPPHPTYISNEILKQILDVHNRKSSDFYYSDDYQSDARIKVDEKGNLTYIFTSYNKHLLSETYISTQYYFEVNTAKYWQDKLDFEMIKSSEIFNNKLVNGIGEILGLLTPPGGSLEKLELIAGILEVASTILPSLIGDYISHNTTASSYLYDKVVDKSPDEKVAILRKATTYEGTRYIWQDNFKSKKTAEGRHSVRKLSPFGFCSQPE